MKAYAIDFLEEKGIQINIKQLDLYKRNRVVRNKEKLWRTGIMDGHTLRVFLRPIREIDRLQKRRRRDRADARKDPTADPM